MNYFPFIWYSLIILVSYSISFFYEDIDSFGKYFLESNWFEHFWILPFYLFFEILLIILNLIERNKDLKIYNTLTDIDKFYSLKNTAVIIPCHKGYDEIKRNRAALQLLFKNIFIADNNNNEGENDDFKNFCFENELYYRYYPEPNKTNAILKTAEYIKDNYSDIYKIVLLDDDTVVSSNFFIRDDLLNDPVTAGYTCCIGINDIKNKNLLEKWIDFEYRTISYRNRAKNFHSLKFLHGIVCVYKIDSLLNIFRWNPCNVGGLPFGEDAYAGLKAREIGYKLKQDNLNTVYTFCPDKLFNFSFKKREQGYGASSVFKQRVLRWYMSWSRRIFNEFALLFYYDCGSWFGNFLYRVDFVWYIWILGNASWWILTIFRTSIYSYDSVLWFLYLHVAFIVLNSLTSFIRRFFMSKNESEHVKWYVPLTYPFFMLILLFFYSFAFVLSILYYIPFFRIDYKKCYKNVV
jgi:hypothetical protein